MSCGVYCDSNDGSKASGSGQFAGAGSVRTGYSGSKGRRRSPARTPPQLQLPSLPVTSMLQSTSF